VPGKIIEKIPTAGLWSGQTDENELGITYGELDEILPLLEKKMPVEKIHEETKIEIEKIKRVKKRMEKTDFKRKDPEKP